MRLLAEAQRDDELIYDIDELMSSTKLLHVVRAKKVRMIYRHTYRFERLIPDSNRAPTPRYVATEFYHVWDLEGERLALRTQTD